jgi:hypothetical protein
MAARAITRGDNAAILDRLRPLIASAHWRNTWLFAAGRLFQEREELRADLISMLNLTDNEGLLSWLARAGAELATDLLADDLAARAPQYRRMLADLAIDRLNGLPDSAWRPLAETLHRLADTDQLVRQKLDRQVSASLAAGGGARAHVLLMLSVWSTSTGGLATRAQQLQHAQSKIDTEEQFGTLLLRRAAISPASTRLDTEDAPRLSAYLAPYIPNLDGEDKTAMDALLAGMRRHKVVRVRITDGSPGAGVALPAAHPPTMGALARAFTRPAVADAFAVTIDQIPAADWHVATILREQVRYWYARRTPAAAA